jgi:4-alpha-glucanotransferase
MGTRASGILLHVTSLPTPYGIGDLGPSAYRFADFLARAKQSIWQMLPLSPTDGANGNSPYSSISAFAGNVLLVSPELMVEDGLLEADDIRSTPTVPQGHCDYPGAARYKAKLFARAHDRLGSVAWRRDEYGAFCRDNAAWLDDYALFLVVKRRQDGRPWNRWPRELRDREAGALREARAALASDVDREKFLQFLFFKQWHALRAHCNRAGIRLIGDMPIYVSYDSVDVWTGRRLFKLGSGGEPAFVAGVPPDYFSTTGQLWGNPVYDWGAHEKDGFAWWLGRIAHKLALFDVVRIDHFRGFVGYWEVPASEKTAVNGRWVAAPADRFFAALVKRFPGLPIVAEDLGVITPDVREIMARFRIPGMRVLLFAFDADAATHPYLPHNYVANCVVYTGTHDNNTARGWFANESTAEERSRFFRYLGRHVAVDDFPLELIRLAMMSIADTVVIPLQDVLGLGEGARMNRPAVPHGNWEWRFSSDQLAPAVSERLSEVTATYGRAPR